MTSQIIIIMIIKYLTVWRRSCVPLPKVHCKIGRQHRFSDATVFPFAAYWRRLFDGFSKSARAWLRAPWKMPAWFSLSMPCWCSSTTCPASASSRCPRRLGIDRNNVSLIVDKLEARGLLKRAVNGADRRARELTITPEGRKLWRGCHPKIRQANERILASLRADEREIFLDMLVRVVEGNRIHARPGGGRRKRGSVQPSVTRRRPSHAT